MMKYAFLLIFAIILVGCSGSDISSSSNEEEACRTESSLFLEDQSGNIIEYPGKDIEVLNELGLDIVGEFPGYLETERRFLKLRYIKYETTCPGKQDKFAALFDECLNRYFNDSLCDGCSLKALEERTSFIKEVFETWNCQNTDGFKCSLDACEYARNH